MKKKTNIDGISSALGIFIEFLNIIYNYAVLYIKTL